MYALTLKNDEKLISHHHLEVEEIKGSRNQSARLQLFSNHAWLVVASYDEQQPVLDAYGSLFFFPLIADRKRLSKG